ncbi:precorrin-6A synthase (deacetylating) [Epibacterium sp. MM17-32]|uniref:precorrin-6A synthase (deacetylating) n=1 Tax=Epibacterium sp. MM17-32 TaxID=2917734 RepID=UPI001EF68700|nr:precorrin-6A synthase (deacetylating) [Epibacterium sp. MM17-32]MCG7627899.1 precorrin-6A synthase (deacetylating) [Epibacterium sp. MM17-32]
MIHLSLIGIGTGNPKHLTREAIEAIQSQDLILIPNKGAGKDDLAGLRQAICADVLADCADPPRIAEFALPTRDPNTAEYRQRVDDWHDAIAAVWQSALSDHLPDGGHVGFLVWGDPSLYDSTMRIAERLRARLDLRMRVIPGITSIQALTAAHGVPLNTIGGPVQITTGRRLREAGWPEGCDTLVVMLDGECSFQSLAEQAQITIHWSAYAGMDNEINIAGRLSEVQDRIIATRAEARADHGWIMDIYLLQRAP